MHMLTSNQELSVISKQKQCSASMIAEDKVESELTSMQRGKSKNSTNKSVSLTNGPLILQVSDWNSRNYDTWKYSHYIICNIKEVHIFALQACIDYPGVGIWELAIQDTLKQYGNVFCRLDLGRERWWVFLIHACLLVCLQWEIFHIHFY